MAKKFANLRAKMSSSQRAKAARRAKAMASRIPLAAMRAARRLSQEEIASALGTGQPSVSRLERRGDMYVSTLRGYVEALGGTLEITARFPDGTVTVLETGKAAR